VTRALSAETNPARAEMRCKLTFRASNNTNNTNNTNKTNNTNDTNTISDTNNYK